MQNKVNLKSEQDNYLIEQAKTTLETFIARSREAHPNEDRLFDLFYRLMCDNKVYDFAYNSAIRNFLKVLVANPEIATALREKMCNNDDYKVLIDMLDKFSDFCTHILDNDEIHAELELYDIVNFSYISTPINLRSTIDYFTDLTNKLPRKAAV